MKREIKFRVWDKTTQKNWNIDKWHFEDEYLDLIEPGVSICDPRIERIWRKQGDVEIMQYTGLTDVNGREIYENDVVHVWDNGTAVVKFDESLDRGQWMCEFIPDEHNAETWSAPLFDWIDGNVDGSVFEILGNIYEHPELLEASK